MKVNHLICIVYLLFAMCININSADDEWIEPHAWGREMKLKKYIPSNKYYDHSTLQEDNELIILFYRKLVNYLINPKMIMQDSTKSNYYQRNFRLHIAKEQLVNLLKIKDSNDIENLRDIDSLLFEIFDQSKSGTLELLKEVLFTWNEWISATWSAIINNKILINIVILCFVGLVWLIFCKFLQMNSIIFGVIVIAFYLHQFLEAECQRNLEIEKMAQHLQYNRHNPCESIHRTWWSYLFGTPVGDCAKFLKENQKTCSIKDVYEGFFKIFIYSQLSIFFETLSDIIDQTKTKYGILVVLVVILILYATSGILIKSIFKYIIGPFILKLTNNSNSKITSNSNDDGGGDRLTGQNIEKILTMAENQTKLAKSLAKNLRKNEKLRSSGVEILLNCENKMKALKLDESIELVAMSTAPVMPTTPTTTTIPTTPTTPTTPSTPTITTTSITSTKPTTPLPTDNLIKEISNSPIKDLSSSMPNIKEIQQLNLKEIDSDSSCCDSDDDIVVINKCV